MTLNRTLTYNESVFKEMNVVSYVSFGKGVLILLLRAGFVLIQIGCVPSNNVNKLVFHNLLDISVSTVLYVSIGYLIAFGEDVEGVVGIPRWVAVDDLQEGNAVMGWSIVMVSSAIFSTVVAGRMSVPGQLIASTVFAGLVQPLALHWVCSGSGWLQSYRDGGGGTTAHASGGTAAFIGAVFLGRRLLLLRELDECSLPPSSPGNICTGYILVMIGLMAISQQGIALLNNMAAASGGALATAVLHKAMGSKCLDYWKMLTCFQGAIAGIVSITPGLEIYHPAMALALGIFGAMICNTVTRLCSLCFLEDYVNVVPVHLICGVLGTLFPPLYTQDFNANVGIEVCWQLVGTLAIVGLTVAAMTPVFCLMMCCSILRDEAESRNHQRALRVANINTPNYWLGRIFRAHSTLPHLRPGYRTKNVETFLDNVREEGVIRNEVQNRQDAGEPADMANSSAEVSSCRLQGIKHQETFIVNKQRNCNQLAKKIATNNTISHLAVFGREPSSMNVKQNSSTSNLQDSKTELVQCGTVQENCDSEKTYKFSYVKKDERYPTMFLAKKLSNGSEIMHNTDATLPIADYTTPTKTDNNSKSETPLMDINNWLSFLQETSSQTSEEDVDQTHEYSTFEMDSLNSEGYTTLEEKGQTFKTNDIPKPLSGSPLRTSPCKIKQENSFTVSPKENIPDSNKGVNLNDINATYSPDNWEKVFLPFYHNSHLSSQISTSDLNFSSLSTSKTTVSRDKYKSDSGLKSGCGSTYQYISKTEPTVLNNQLEVDVGDADNTAKHGSKSDISKHIMLLHKMKSKFNSLDNIS